MTPEYSNTPEFYFPILKEVADFFVDKGFIIEEEPTLYHPVYYPLYSIVLKSSDTAQNMYHIKLSIADYDTAFKVKVCFTKMTSEYIKKINNRNDTDDINTFPSEYREICYETGHLTNHIEDPNWYIAFITTSIHDSNAFSSFLANKIP